MGAGSSETVHPRKQTLTPIAQEVQARDRPIAERSTEKSRRERTPERRGKRNGRRSVNVTRGRGEKKRRGSESQGAVASCMPVAHNSKVGCWRSKLV